jgi:hypothetical protein
LPFKEEFAMRGVRAIVVLATLLISLLTVSQNVEAAACKPSHCYGVAVWQNAPTNSGSYVYLTTSCLNGPNDSSNFADEELWEGTANSYGTYWVETGLSYGEINGTPMGGPYWFWADNRPNGGGYHEHYVGARSLNTTYLAQIGYEGSNQWYVYTSPGGTVGTSTYNPPYSNFMQTGEEITSGSYNVYGFSSDMSWFDTSGAGHANWQSGSNYSTVYSSGSPTHSYWNITYSEVGYYANCGHAAASPLAKTQLTPPLQPGQVKPQSPATLRAGALPVPADAVPTLTDLSRRMVGTTGSQSVGPSKAVLTTRQIASAAAAQARVNSDQAVYLVQIEGQFTALSARVPVGQSAPFGHYLTFTVDASTGFVLDWGVSDVMADLSALGPVKDLGL